IHLVGRIADHASAILFHANLGRMADLNGVARDHGEFVARDTAARVAGGGIEGVGPYAIAADIGNTAIEHLEIRCAFLEQNAAGGVVAFAGIRAAAIVDLNVVNPNGVARVDEDCETGDLGGPYLPDFQIG